MALADYTSKVKTFRALHESGCFLIPNPWDIGSAIALERLGFKALATTSAGFAFSHGLADGISQCSLTDTLTHFRVLVAATNLPINADFQDGFASVPEDVAKHVLLCAKTGVAGLSIEDATGQKDRPLYNREEAIERVRAARSAIDEAETGALLTARCEAWLVGESEPQTTAIDRLVAFAEAGADCLFAPGVKDPRVISEIVKAVSPKPVNLLVSAPVADLTVPRIAELGVRRISLGSALARVAWGAWLEAVQRIAESGEFNSLAEAAPFETLNEMFRKK